MSAARELATDLFPDLYCPAPPPAALTALPNHLAEIAPGVWVSGLPEFEVPSHVICRLVPGEKPGTYTLEPEPYPGYVRMCEDIGKKLGVIGLSDTTLRRLMWGGFIDHIRPAPGCLFISIESLMEHFKRTGNDCEKEKSYWTHSRREEWRVTCEGTSNIED